MSARPGMRNFPRPSMRRAPDGTRTVRDAPTAAMRPSRTSTVASWRTVSEVIGITDTLVIAKVPRASAPRDGWAAAGRVAAAMMLSAATAIRSARSLATGWDIVSGTGVEVGLSIMGPGPRSWSRTLAHYGCAGTPAGMARGLITRREPVCHGGTSAVVRSAAVADGALVHALDHRRL